MFFKENVSWFGWGGGEGRKWTIMLITNLFTSLITGSLWNEQYDAAFKKTYKPVKRKFFINIQSSEPVELNVPRMQSKLAVDGLVSRIVHGLTHLQGVHK
jgi:hypothetical protein